jgi:hypothetical protein
MSVQDGDVAFREGLGDVHAPQLPGTMVGTTMPRFLNAA